MYCAEDFYQSYLLQKFLFDTKKYGRIQFSSNLNHKYIQSIEDVKISSEYF